MDGDSTDNLIAYCTEIEEQPIIAYASLQLWEDKESKSEVTIYAMK